MSERKIGTASGRACVLRGNDIDTDRIIPARYLMCVTFEALGEFAIEDDRKEAKGNHALDDERFNGAKILVVESNFGCGSSREHAPQALMRHGFTAFIGVSFGEIFSGNCTANGLICARLSPEDVTHLEAEGASFSTKKADGSVQSFNFVATGVTFSNLAQPAEQ